MFHYYKIALLIGLFALPLLILAWKNRFDSVTTTAVRFALAIVVIWAYLLASRFIVDAVDLSLAASQEEIQAICDGDGAKNAFALLFGWVPGLIVALISRLLARGWSWLRARTGIAKEII